MSEDQPRVRMFAGPNGSGKSSLKEVLPERLQGVYLNPDELEAQLRRQGRLDLAALRLSGASERTFSIIREMDRHVHGSPR